MPKFYMRMSPADFVRKVIDLYFAARSPNYYHPSIKRGRSRTISGQVEDLCALFFAININKKYTYLVDQAITFNKETIYPDIAIIDNNELKSIIDVKMDLG
ncbi:hypothetical protein AGMMS50293_08220 [Spirochaetia bacterium]|nr:hypothetical protein AGMMS50293_08220 [Spirochaetia bacterium]